MCPNDDRSLNLDCPARSSRPRSPQSCEGSPRFASTLLCPQSPCFHNPFPVSPCSSIKDFSVQPNPKPHCPVAIKPCSRKLMPCAPKPCSSTPYSPRVPRLCLESPRPSNIRDSSAGSPELCLHESNPDSPKPCSSKPCATKPCSFKLCPSKITTPGSKELCSRSPRSDSPKLCPGKKSSRSSSPKPCFQGISIPCSKSNSMSPTPCSPRPSSSKSRPDNPCPNPRPCAFRPCQGSPNPYSLESIRQSSPPCSPRSSMPSSPQPCSIPCPGLASPCFQELSNPSSEPTSFTSPVTPRPCSSTSSGSATPSTVKICSRPSTPPCQKSPSCSSKFSPIKCLVKLKSLLNKRDTTEGGTCTGDVEELYFNKEIKQSDASADWDQCLNHECLQSFESARNISCAISPMDQCLNRECLQSFESARNISCAISAMDTGESGNSGQCSSYRGSVSSSMGGSGSGSGSTGGACDAARAAYYHRKLLATMQILQNKEDTVRVQGESLAVAEARIAALTARAAQMRMEIDRKGEEIRALRMSLRSPRQDVTKPTCVSVQTGPQDRDMQKDIVTTLQTNLSVIEELYRECFFETAKQEELIDKLRKSCLDVRLVEKEKCDQIGRLQNVIINQRWSLDKCQDIAVDVENLKVEISSFLNNSNNDSGMWERSEDSVTTEVGEDLQDIMDQLLQLKELLAGDCTCGLGEENVRLKEENETMQIQIAGLCQKTSEMEAVMIDKDSTIKQLVKQTHDREEELLSARQQIEHLEEKARERDNACDCLEAILKNTQEHLEVRTAELSCAQQACAGLEATAGELRRDLARAQQAITENVAVRVEVSELRHQVSEWRAQLAASEARVRGVEGELLRAREHCAGLQHCYSEKVCASRALQAQLGEAHARGAALCAEARRVVGDARRGLRDMRKANREQEEKIQEQRATISSLQRLREHVPCASACADAARHASCPAVPVGCSKCARKRLQQDSCPSASETRYSKCDRNRTQTIEASVNESEIPSCSRSLRSETTSCGYKSASERPVPPRRVLRKKKTCGDSRCGAVRMREASVQEPTCSEAGTGAGPEEGSGALGPGCARAPLYCTRYHVQRASLTAHPATRAMSPSQELLERVELLQDALEDGHRRWSRPRLDDGR